MGPKRCGEERRAAAALRHRMLLRRPPRDKRKDDVTEGLCGGETHRLLRPCLTGPDLVNSSQPSLQRPGDYRAGSLRPGEEWRKDIIGRYGRAPIKKKKKQPIAAIKAFRPRLCVTRAFFNVYASGGRAID